MNKEDWKLVGMILLFILYLVFGVSCAYATVIVTKEEGWKTVNKKSNKNYT